MQEAARAGRKYREKFFSKPTTVIELDEFFFLLLRLFSIHSVSGVLADFSFFYINQSFPKKVNGQPLTQTCLELRHALQYVAQYPDSTSIRTLETKTQFLRRPFQFSVNEVLQMKAEHFSFKMRVLAI